MTDHDRLCVLVEGAEEMESLFRDLLDDLDFVLGRVKGVDEGDVTGITIGESGPELRTAGWTDWHGATIAALEIKRQKAKGKNQKAKGGTVRSPGFLFPLAQPLT
jgi:hypothetical protein